MSKSIKHQVKTYLVQKEYQRLLDLCEKDVRFWKELRFHLYDIDEKLRWSAIEAIARFMQHLWQTGHKEKVREFIRNLFWSMNDESGGIGWSAAPTIAEIIVQIPELLNAYGSMMLYHALEEPPLLKGGLWGIGRLGQRIKNAVDFFQDKVLETFQYDDPEILGLAAWAMGEVGFTPALSFLKKLKDRNELVQIYIEGHFYKRPLGSWAKESIRKIYK